MAVNIINSFSGNTNYADMQMRGTKSVDQELQEVAAVFAEMMNLQPDLSTSLAEPVSSNNAIEDVKSVSSASDSYERYSYKENHINEAKGTDFTEKIEEVSSELEEFEQKALDAVSEEFGVEKEEILAVLDEMGLSVMDLLNPQNLVSFVMELTGLTAKEDLLLNDSFLSIMSTMDAMKKELMTELNVTPEGLEQLVELMEQVNPEEEQLVNQMEQTEAVSNEAPVVDETTTVDENLVEVTEEVAEEVVDTKGVAEDAKVVENSETEETTMKTEVVQEENTDFAGTEEKSFERNTSGKSEKNHLTDTNQQSGESFMTVNSNVDVVQPTTDSSQVSSYMTVNTMEIIEQIAEQIKINVTTETTTMEMQLNPENLGKIHISISEENGVINAQFTATSEVVKEALESQLATLRENLNQAGVKVDAIEVTVETHQFESNLEQNHKREENEGAYKEELIQKRRNINLNTLDELSGLMTEEEALVAQIMRDNGNSVDLTA